MKYLSKIIIAVCLFYSQISYAQNAQYEILNKSFSPASKSTELEISNNFGNITVATWDKNTIAVKISLDVEGYDEQESKKILDKIDLKTNETSSTISIKTNLKSHNSSSFRKKSFKINYEINLPDGHPLNLNNEFGNIFMTDYSGKTNINLEYGNLTAGTLGELYLKHEFGKGEIESITKGIFEMEYVDAFSLTDAKELELTAEFSKFEIENIKTISFDIEYGKLLIGTVSNYNGISEFTEITIDKLYDNFKLDAEYASGTIEIKSISKDIQSFELDTEFSKAEIKIEEGANLGFDTKHSFGKLKTEGASFNFSKKIKDMSDEEYTGTIGDQPNNIKTILKIRTNYGGCTIIAD
ncbi:hypothetical protein MATR_14850 [Marivirga tractuosa]|uniref:Adhesin domain-containing protein n=2 Tax=Marivirga TaxID=869806 RepID=E4TT41_MARTH|nr:hypothetical protein Ftrac_0887 [Marivirga tractuosa DSM 4126]BDD14660.1 hypothetical protein MATR_14850 [Marivirga tractuosa]